MIGRAMTEYTLTQSVVRNGIKPKRVGNASFTIRAHSDEQAVRLSKALVHVQQLFYATRWALLESSATKTVDGEPCVLISRRAWLELRDAFAATCDKHVDADADFPLAGDAH